jgi:plasmid stability protein
MMPFFVGTTMSGGRSVAQLVIPNVDDALEEPLRARASRNGRTLEAEVCAILEEAEPQAPEQAFREDGTPGLGTEEKGFGGLMYERFKDIGLKEDEVRRFNAGIAEFNSKWEMGLPDFEEDEYEETQSKKW